MGYSNDLIWNVLNSIEVHFPKDGINLNEVVQDFEEVLILKSLVATNGNCSQAARLCGLRPSTFANKVAKTNFRKPKKKAF